MLDASPLDHGLGVALPALSTAYGIGPVTGQQFLADGLMNRNWRVETPTGSYAVKQLTDVPLAKVRRNHSVLAPLAAEGLPVAPPMATEAADTVVESGGHGYSVMPWVDGAHVPGTELLLDEARELGQVLGRLHLGLARHQAAPLPDEPPAAKITPPDGAVAAADRLLERLADHPDPLFVKSAAEALHQRKTLLDTYARLRPEGTVPAGPFGWTHGDFQYRNILRRDGQVVAILDWDRLAVRPYAEEVARTAQVQFGMGGVFDLERVAAFTAGYRTVVDLPEDALADGLARLWWKRATDFWQLEFHLSRPADGFDTMFFADEDLLHWWTARLEDVQSALTGR